MSNFSNYFEQKNYRCYNPTFRYHDKPRSDETAARLAGTSITDYVEDIIEFVETLDTAPILVGHSLGGLIAQKVAATGRARAIVLLNGSVNWGILPTTDQERALGKMFMSAGAFWEGTLLPDFETMAQFGLNKLDPTEQHRVFDLLVPESGRVMFELFFWMFDENQTTKIDYEGVACPVLMVSGSDDLAIPPSTARLIAERHGSLTTFHEAEGFGHYLTLEPEWKKIAKVCENWIIEQVPDVAV
ncbi:MAG: alpha/beta hydrolase [Planctomycetes bacterium]|nr:alpha/beta hydrolase [Planctomycetota bacterium]MCH9725514.1 alpha/beta hydrolase [Planctomycetota bacterium]MCH9776493.1 alpha/beta hydrolase [Planctomycetota bacterium]MCH9790466.1 alpha/beta hydrolase [Planctomycetota bacterium]